MSSNPRVTIGIPVYNGENYLAESIESILAQTFTDFELIISDNASTDQTEAICRAFVARDGRVRYSRNEVNVGAAKNYNLLVDLAKGEYFKWQAHDDKCAPTFLARCVEVLDQDPALVLSYTGTADIDAEGNVTRKIPPKPTLSEPHASKRFYECVCVPHPQTSVFGLIRTAVLRQTRLIGNYSSSDRTLLGELSLRGPFYELPDYLFFKRHHPQAHWKVYRTRHARQVWYDPAKRGKITFPHWRLLREHLYSVWRVPLNLLERVRCHLVLGWWIRKQWRRLAKNLILQG